MKHHPAFGLAVLAVALLIASALPCSAVVYVKWDSPGPTFDGNSWETAYHTLQPAINDAEPGMEEVWVAKGTYVGCIVVRPGVRVYGGFTGSETALDQRDLLANETLLDGNQQGTVVTAGLEAMQSRIDGFTICNGKATYGGGVNCFGSDVIIANNIVTKNAATYGGGGIYGNGARMTLVGNTVTGNSSNYGEPGISWVRSALVRILSNRIYGGGITCTETSRITMTNNVVSGAGVSITASDTVTVTNNTIVSGDGISISCARGTVANNLVAFNRKGITYPAGALVLRNNCVFNPDGVDYPDRGRGTGDISVDPCLAAWQYGRVHIQPGSPCRDAGYDFAVGADWLDMDGQPRILGDHVDIGADESDGTTWDFIPRIVRVSPSGSDANDGSSWELAKRTVQAGLDSATQEGGDVWVAAGVYPERIFLRPAVYLYGGFAGDETALVQRDWRCNVSVLDGENEGTVVAAVSLPHGLCAVDGFTICNGRADGGSGSGISCHQASPTIVNNIIKRCGYGVYCNSSSAVLANNLIAGNDDYGICCKTSSVTICNCVVVCNDRGISTDGKGTIANTIIAFNTGGVDMPGIKPGIKPVLKHNCVYGNRDYNYSSLEDPTGKDGNISSDPMFACLPNYDCRLRPDSPCVDAGINSMAYGDLDAGGQPRVQPLGGIVDIGAYESDRNEPISIPGVVVRVSPGGDDANDGSSWALAKRTVQAGIDAATTPGGEVWVRSGTYSERITLHPFTQVYGGFAGHETTLEQKSPSANVTILDGQQGGSVVTATAGIRASTIDGFTITNGRAQYYGGGIYCGSAAPTISNNVITGNVAPYHGGGIYCTLSEPLIAKNVITRNSAWSGSGIACRDCSPVITGNIIARNISEGTYTNTYGGGVYCGTNSPHSANNTMPYIANNTIVENTAAHGGGIYCDIDSSPNIVNTIIAGNSSGVCRETATKPGTGAPVFSHNCVYGNGDHAFKGLVDPTGKDGNIAVDPGLVATDEFCHLLNWSQCINAGSASVADQIPFDIDGEGRMFGAAPDIGADECWSLVMNPSDAKRAPKGAKIAGIYATASAAFDGCFYLQPEDRTSGIMVVRAGHTIQAGDRVAAAGNVGISADGETCIDATAVRAVSLGTPIVPIGMANRSIGGDGFFRNPLTSTGQQGVKEYRPVRSGDTWIRTLVDAAGLNNIGLLVKAWGKVTCIGDGFFYLDDGSHLDDGSGRIGLKVALEGLSMPDQDSFVSVIGVSSCSKSGTDLFRLLRAVEITPVSQ